MVSIVAVLIALLLPSLEAARRQALHVRCQANLRQIGTGFASYAADYDGFLPYRVRVNGEGPRKTSHWHFESNNLPDLHYKDTITDYISPSGVYACPLSEHDWRKFWPDTSGAADTWWWRDYNPFVPKLWSNWTYWRPDKTTGSWDEVINTRINDFPARPLAGDKFNGSRDDYRSRGPHFEKPIDVYRPWPADLTGVAGVMPLNFVFPDGSVQTFEKGFTYFMHDANWFRYWRVRGQ